MTSSTTQARSAARGGRRIVLGFVVALAAVASLALWDERREQAAALDDFAEEQVALAAAVAREVGARLASAPRDGLARASALELLRREHVGADRPGLAVALFAPPDASELVDADGARVASPPIERALAEGRTRVWLDREEAAAIGLPARRAAVGLARADAGTLGVWRVALATSALRVRDRERRAELRLALTVVLGAALALGFARVALDRQRRALDLERDLALADLELRADERLARSTRAATMGTLAMGIGHEVSTPLGVIAGRAEQLEARVVGDERAARAVAAIREQTEKIRRIVRAFLDLARGAAPALASCDPKEIVAGSIELVEHRFDKASVTLERDAAHDLPKVRCDKPMLSHALANLLLNACDACERGGRVRVSARVEGERVVFAVRDDGAGIPPEIAAHVTDPFFTTKAPGQGTGLGLAIAHEIVRMHRGELSLEPIEPRGTLARVALPKETT